MRFFPFSVEEYLTSNLSYLGVVNCQWAYLTSATFQGALGGCPISS